MLGILNSGLCCPPSPGKDLIAPFALDEIDCGIVTFNPDIARLEENLRTVIDQVALVHIFDNGSENLADVVALANAISESKIHVTEGGYVLGDFRELPFVLPVAASGINRKVREYFKEKGLAYRVLAEGRNEQMIAGFVQSGRAAGICMRRNADAIVDGAPGEFKVFPLAEPDFAGSEVLVMRRGVEMSGAVEELVRVFVEGWNAV